MERELGRHREPVTLRCQKAFTEGDSVGGAEPTLSGEDTNEDDVVDANGRDSSGEALAGGLDARDLVMRKQVVDPFLVGIRDKSCDINVIDASQNYPSKIG